MSRGKRYNGEAHLNYTKVFAVLIAIVVIVMCGFLIKNLITGAKNTQNVGATSYFALYKDNKWGVVNSNGELTIDPMYQEMLIVPDSSKDIFLCTYDLNEETGDYKTKAINSKNEQIFTGYSKIEALENFDENKNVWYEQDVLKVQKNGLWGLINLEGNEILAPEYDNIETLKGLKESLIIEKNGLLGLVNNKGMKILDIKYTKIEALGKDYKEGYITVNEENKYGIYSFSGKQILENKYDKIERIYSENYFVIKDGEKQKLINTKGEVILEEGFDEISQIATSGIVFKKDNKYGLMSFDKNILIDAKYEALKEINKNVFMAKNEGLCGIITEKDEIKIKFEYKDIYYNSKSGMYIAEDKDFNSIIIDTNYNIKLKGILSELNTEKGYMKLKINGEYKYYNFKFEEKNIFQIFKTNTLALSKKDGKYGFVNEKNEVIVDYIYDDATEQNEYGYAAIKKDGKWGSIDSKGNIVIEPKYNLDNNLVINFIGKYHLGTDLNMNYYCEK